jgi:opacity protein-like surface antigen
MNNAMKIIRAILLVAVTSLLLGSLAAADAVSYHVTVNTSSINGQSGYLDFSLLPSAFDSQLATVQVLNFGTDGVVSANPAFLTGDASGMLPGTISLDNATFFNDYFQDFTFGNSLSFDLLLGGPALESPDGVASGGSTFTFGMFANDQVTPLLSTSPNGEALDVNVNLDGTASYTTYPAAAGQPSAVQVVPEPASLTLLVSGAFGLLMFRKRSK